jgi:hypothetical protein
MNNSNFAKKSLHISIITALGLGFFSSAFSATWNSNNTGCSNADIWSNNFCWNGGTVPGAGEDAIVRNNSGTDITVDYNTASPTLNSLVVEATSSGTTTLTRNSNITLDSNEVYIGRNGSAVSSVIHNAGSSTFGNGYIGSRKNASGYYELNDTDPSSNSSLEWGDLDLGNVGYGEFTQSSGTTHTINDSFQIGTNDTGSGKYTLNGGTLTVGGTEEVGRFGDGEFTQNGGTHNVDFLHIARKSGTGIYQLNGGDLVVTDGLEVGTIPTSNASFVQNGGSVTVGTAANPGTVVVSASGLATGSYQLNAGTLQASLIENKDYFEHSGGEITGDIDNYDELRFSGNGTRQVQGSITNIGQTTFTHNPAGAPAPITGTSNSLIELMDGTMLNISSDLTLNDLGTFTMDLGSNTVATSEFVNVGGTAALGGILELNIDTGFSAESGDIWTLFTASDIDSMFSQVLFNESFVDLQFSLTYTDTTVNLLATSVSPVPVPPALWLFGSGLVGLVSLSRRGRKKLATSCN